MENKRPNTDKEGGDKADKSWELTCDDCGLIFDKRSGDGMCYTCGEEFDMGRRKWEE